MRKPPFKVGTFYTTVIFFALAVVAHAQPARSTKVVDTSGLEGRFEGRVYKNDFFRFSVQLSEDGVVINKPQTELFKSAGSDAVKGGGGSNSERIQRDLDTEIIVVNYASKPLGSVDNSVLTIGVQKQPVGQTANMVLAATTKALTMTGKFEVTEFLKGKKIGGIAVAAVRAKLNYNGTKIDQEVFMMVRRGYAITFGINYFSPAGLERIERILDTTRFDTK